LGDSDGLGALDLRGELWGLIEGATEHSRNYSAYDFLRPRPHPTTRLLNCISSQIPRFADLVLGPASTSHERRLRSKPLMRLTVRTV